MTIRLRAISINLKLPNSINGDIVQKMKLKSCTLFFGEKKQHTANNNGKESNSKTTILYKKEHTSVSKINSHYKSLQIRISTIMK
ncbi:hypothetical protein PL373_02195 [Tenacibaculum maritimum]|nr:hypothetical protein [Tenacibaculum maritimum]MDB0599983.1 hypothetical protein [Tenacibaculum maritimum]MDB0611127.1 hypothetical protein [Tenacibaculum maritimum]